MTSTPEPIPAASSPAAAVSLPRWLWCFVAAAGLLVWGELAGVRTLLFARDTVTTWGWIRAGALYGALALFVLVSWERVVPFLRAPRFWVALGALIAVLYQPVWLTEDLPRRLGLSGGDVTATIDDVRVVQPSEPVVPFMASSQQRFGRDDETRKTTACVRCSGGVCRTVGAKWRVVDLGVSSRSRRQTRPVSSATCR